MRTENLDRTAAVWTASEARRPGQLRRTTDHAAADLRHHAEQYQRMERYIVDWQRRDADRWQQRQRLYADELERILGGHPERIEPNAITLFY